MQGARFLLQGLYNIGFFYRATDGKIAKSDAMPVFVAIMEEYQQDELLMSEKDINEGIKENLQVKEEIQEHIYLMRKITSLVFAHNLIFPHMINKNLYKKCN